MSILTSYIRKNIAFIVALVGTAGAVCTAINLATSTPKIDLLMDENAKETSRIMKGE